MQEINKITPDFFYKSVSLKTGVTIETVKDIYQKYLSRIHEVSKIDSKVLIRGLGTFRVSSRLAISELYNVQYLINLYYDDYMKEYINDLCYIKLKHAVKIIKYLNKLKRIHAFIEKSMEPIWANPRGLTELIDREGNFRKDIKRENDNLLDMPFEEG